MVSLPARSVIVVLCATAVNEKTASHALAYTATTSILSLQGGQGTKVMANDLPEGIVAEDSQVLGA